jgi:hypothetical protein
VVATFTGQLLRLFIYSDISNCHTVLVHEIHRSLFIFPSCTRITFSHREKLSCSGAFWTYWDRHFC